MKSPTLIALLVLLAAAATRAAGAEATTAATATTTTTATATTSPTTLPSPTIALTVGEEEKKKVIRALVKLNDKPLENAVVNFSVKRTFGLLNVGKDTTLDDGTAVAPFPTGLPGGSDGQMQIVAVVAHTPQYGDAVAAMTTPGGAILTHAEDPFPRALWAPHAPLQLIIPIFMLLGGVWVTYAYVISQIIAIWRGAAR